MRKLKLQVQISINGYIAGPTGEMDWMTWNWDTDLVNYVAALNDPIDTIVLDRKLAEGFIPYWAGVAADDGNEQQSAGKKFTDTPKVVFSRSLTESLWDNTALAEDDLIKEINKLKATEGGDIMAYGGASFVSSLIKDNLIDEYHLFVNPAAIPSGLPIFETATAAHQLELVKATGFNCGITVLHYKAKR